MDIVEKVAKGIAEMPGDQSVLNVARVAIEEYQKALMPGFFDSPRTIMPEYRYNRANMLTAHIMQVVGKYLCEHGETHGGRDAARELFEMFYEAGADIITDADRAAAGLLPRDEHGLTREEFQILEAKRIQAMLAPMPPIFIPAAGREVQA